MKHSSSSVIKQGSIAGLVAILLTSTVATAQVQIIQHNRCAQIETMRRDLQAANQEVSDARARIQELNRRGNIIVNHEIPTLEQNLIQKQAILNERQSVYDTRWAEVLAAGNALEDAKRFLVQVRGNLYDAQTADPVDTDLVIELTAQVRSAEESLKAADELVQRLRVEVQPIIKSLEEAQAQVANINSLIDRLKDELHRNQVEIEQLYYDIRSILEPKVEKIHTRLQYALRNAGTCHGNNTSIFEQYSNGSNSDAGSGDSIQDF